MQRSSLKNFFFILAAVLIALQAGCKAKVQPAEAPEEVVRKFYAYIKEGGPTTLNEAYRLIDPKNNVDEGRFKQTVSQYPVDMDVKVLKCVVDEKNDRATVTIEYRTASSFGGYMTTNTDINLTLDKEAKCWRIDFAGETYEESPAMYTQGGKG